MSQGLKPCRKCGNEHPEIASGDMVICDECGLVMFFDDWQAGAVDLSDEDRDSSYWDARLMDEEEGEE